MTGGLQPHADARKRSNGTAMVLVLLLVAGGLSSPVGADAQDDLTLGDVLEAETFQTADAMCDPDFDGEHTVAKNDTAASGGAYAFLPHSGCGIGFGNVSFDEHRRFTQFVVRVGGSSDPYQGLLRVFVDDMVVAEGTYAAHHTDQFVNGSFDRISDTVPAGTHALRVEYTTTSGPYFGNLEIDLVRTEITSGGGGGGGGAPALADMVVTVDGLVAHPHDPADLYVTFRIDNKGDAAADGIAVDVWYDGTYAGRTEFPVSLRAGWTSWVSHPWPYTSGNHTIRAVVDPDGTIQETNEENNEELREIPADTPDVYVNRVWEPEPLDADGWTSARFFLFSVGTATMPETTVEILIDGVVRATTTVDALPVGTAQEFVVPFQAEPGTRLLTIHVDPDDAVTELEERRNKWRMTVDLGPEPVPDLAANLEMPVLDGRHYGETIQTTASVQNDGDAWSEQAHAIVTLDGAVLFEGDIPALAPDTTHSIPVDVPLTAGADRLELVIDPLGQPDADPTNDRAQVRLALASPDLKAVALELDEEVPEEGRPIEITAAFTYNGTLALPGAQAVLMDGDRILATWALDVLEPNATYTFGYTWNAKEGDHDLRFEVSAPHDIDEAQPADNFLERSVSVRAPTPATCRDAGTVAGSPGLQETCRRVLLGEEDPLGPL